MVALKQLASELAEADCGQVQELLSEALSLEARIRGAMPTGLQAVSGEDSMDSK